MTTPHKSTRPKAEAAEVIDSFVPLYTKNVERLAEFQKKTLEIAAEQNAELVDTLKKAFRFAPEMPGLFWFDMLSETFERFVETEKGVIDLALEQSHTVAELAKERGTTAGKVADGATAMFRQTMEHSVAAQKKAVDFFAEQQKTAYETAKKQFRVSNPFAEAFQSGLEALLETQKSLLDIASKPVKHSAAA